jgi:hypothetical protein
LDRALSEVKKAYEESATQLDDAQALDALVSCFRNASNDDQVKKVVTRILAPYVSA